MWSVTCLGWSSHPQRMRGLLRSVPTHCVRVGPIQLGPAQWRLLHWDSGTFLEHRSNQAGPGVWHRAGDSGPGSMGEKPLGPAKEYRQPLHPWLLGSRCSQETVRQTAGHVGLLKTTSLLVAI